MPYLPYSELDEQKKKAEQNGQVNISGGSTTINQSAQNVAAPKPVQRSGSWTNLDAYLNANKDNAADLGNTISQNISNQGNQVRTGIQSSTDDFNSQVDKGTISNLAGAKQDASNIVQKAKSSLQDDQINDDQVNRFKDVSNAQYKGPFSLDASQYYQDTQSKLNKAKDYQSNAQSDEGRFNLLQEMFNRPTYSQGQKNLDNLLLTGNDQAKSSIQNAANSLNDLQGSWDKANTDAQGLATQRNTDTNDARKYAQDELINNRSARSGEIDTNLKDIQNQWSNEYNHYNDLLSKYQGGELSLTKDEAAKLGLLREAVMPQNVIQKISTGSRGPTYLSPQIFNTLNGVSPSAYLDRETYDENKVINRDQFAQLAALDKLANQFGAASSSRFNDESQAGTLGLNNNFSASRFGDAQKAAQEAFNNYARGANFNGTGSASESYHASWLNDDSVTRNSSLSANLADVLNGAGYMDNKAVGVDTNNLLIPGAINSIVGNTLSGDAEKLVNSIVGNSGKAEAERAAQMHANNQAQASLYQQIMDALNNQGFNNVVKIK